MIKHIIGILVLLGGGVLGWYIFQHPIGAFVGIVVGWPIRYFILKFPRYLRASPKGILEFHQTNDFSKMFSAQELESLKARLAKGGLLKMIDNQGFYCSVDSSIWATLSELEKLAFCKLCYESCIKINGEKLSNYYCVYNHKVDFATSPNRELLSVFSSKEGGLISVEEFGSNL